MKSINCICVLVPFALSSFTTQGSAQFVSPGAAQAKPHSVAVPLPPPPGKTDAGGKNIPNVGTHHLKKIASAYGGLLPSSAMKLPKDTVPPANPAPLGWVLTDIGYYLPDTAAVGQPQSMLTDLLSFHFEEQYPETFALGNSDPSGSLDETALDESGKPIHFNLHWPQEEARYTWLSDLGLLSNSPTDDLESIVDDVVASGSKARIQEAFDILLGTNVSGALSTRAYNGYNLLKIYKAKNNKTFNTATRNVNVTQLWYDTEIYTDSHLLELPAHGDFTITWHFRGLGDIGLNREKAFPIDEAAPHLMRETINAEFWIANAWIWKWFVIVQPQERAGAKYSLEALYHAHTGSSDAPSYPQLNPNDKRYWLHADRKFDLGRYVGEGNPYDKSRFRQLDLDLSGALGGYLVSGVSTGQPYNSFTNKLAQFNQYGNNEIAVPVVDWSMGALHTPFVSMDSTFTTVRKGQDATVTVRYSNGEALEGIYNWGWRVHPPRINWIETYAPGQILPSGALKEWRFANKWDEIEAQGLAAIGEHAPEKVLYNALAQYQASAGTALDLAAFKATTKDLLRSIRDRRVMPDTTGISGFPSAQADINFLYTNFDIYSDRDKASPKGTYAWHEGDVIKVCVHNDDNVTRFFRVVDFGTTDYQYNGTDMGLLDWKPVFGVPQVVALAWRPKLATTIGWGAQGLPLGSWAGTALAGTGNPLYVDPNFHDPANYWLAGERDLIHDFADLGGFSGPGFVAEFGGQDSVWANAYLAGKPTGAPGIWDYAYGKPIPPHTTITFSVEMPRSMALNNGAMYMFDPQFHASAVFTMHPESELHPEGLDD